MDIKSQGYWGTQIVNASPCICADQLLAVKQNLVAVLHRSGAVGSRRHHVALQNLGSGHFHNKSADLNHEVNFANSRVSNWCYRQSRTKSK